MTVTAHFYFSLCRDFADILKGKGIAGASVLVSDECIVST